MKQKQVHTDEQLQALLSQCQIVEPDLLCDKQNRIGRVCANPLCQKPSLICQKSECQQCGGQNHLHCLSLQLKSISTLLSQKHHRLKDFTIDVCKIENKFVNQLHSTRYDLIKQYYLGDLEEKYRRIVKEIYKNKNTRFLKGKQAKEFYKRLHASQQKNSQNAHQVLAIYQTFMKNLINQIIPFKKRLYQSFIQPTELSIASNLQARKKVIDSIILNSSLSVQLSKVIIYEKLLTRIAEPSHKEFLMTALNNPKRLQLLYRGSENAFSAAAFHQKCDDIPNTLTILRTEFGKTIAGFTKYTWNAVKNAYVHDSGRHTFLLSLDLKQKMISTTDQNLIYCSSGNGPTFGVGHDLRITNQCDKNTNSNANFPSSYNCEGANKYTNNQENYRMFSGATNNNKFRVLEYEVFRVVYQ